MASVGDVVELVSCDDPYTKIAPGTRGVVDYVEGAGDRIVVVGRQEP